MDKVPMTVRAAYEKYQYLDEALSTMTILTWSGFPSQILCDLWEAVKNAVDAEPWDLKRR